MISLCMPRSLCVKPWSLFQKEMKAVWAQVVSWCVYDKPKNYVAHDGFIPYIFDCWADPVVHLLLLKSSMVRLYQNLFMTSAPYLKFWPFPNFFAHVWGSLSKQQQQSSSGSNHHFENADSKWWFAWFNDFPFKRSREWKRWRRRDFASNNISPNRQTSNISRLPKS